jgi:hypothetical protein
MDSVCIWGEWEDSRGNMTGDRDLGERQPKQPRIRNREAGALISDPGWLVGHPEVIHLFIHLRGLL